jgi:hypothetical protein
MKGSFNVSIQASASSGYNRQTLPLDRRTPRPALWLAAASEIGRVIMELIIIRGLYRHIFSRPVSMTWTMSSIVMLVSAILVERMIFRAALFLWTAA